MVCGVSDSTLRNTDPPAGTMPAIRDLGPSCGNRPRGNVTARPARTPSRTHQGQTRGNHPEDHRPSRTRHRTRRNAPRTSPTPALTPGAGRPMHTPRPDPPPQPGKGVARRACSRGRPATQPRTVATERAQYGHPTVANSLTPSTPKPVTGPPGPATTQPPPSVRSKQRPIPGQDPEAPRKRTILARRKPGLHDQLEPGQITADLPKPAIQKWRNSRGSRDRATQSLGGQTALVRRPRGAIARRPNRAY